MQQTDNARDSIIARIEAKYKKCKTCGRNGISKNHPTCFYCGSRK